MGKLQINPEEYRKWLERKPEKELSDSEIYYKAQFEKLLLQKRELGEITKTIEETKRRPSIFSGIRNVLSKVPYLGKIFKPELKMLSEGSNKDDNNQETQVKVDNLQEDIYNKIELDKNQIYNNINVRKEKNNKRLEQIELRQEKQNEEQKEEWINPEKYTGKELIKISERLQRERRNRLKTRENAAKEIGLIENINRSKPVKEKRTISGFKHGFKKGLLKATTGLAVAIYLTSAFNVLSLEDNKLIYAAEHYQSVDQTMEEETETELSYIVNEQTEEAEEENETEEVEEENETEEAEEENETEEAEEENETEEAEEENETEEVEEENETEEAEEENKTEEVEEENETEEVEEENKTEEVEEENETEEVEEEREAEKREAEKREAEKREAEKREAEKREAEKKEAEKREAEKRDAENRKVVQDIGYKQKEYIYSAPVTNAKEVNEALKNLNSRISVKTSDVNNIRKIIDENESSRIVILDSKAEFKNGAFKDINIGYPMTTLVSTVYENPSCLDASDSRMAEAINVAQQIQSFTKELTKDCKTEEEKIKVIFEYVSKHVTYDTNLAKKITGTESIENVGERISAKNEIFMDDEYYLKGISNLINGGKAKGVCFNISNYTNMLMDSVRH